jgi:predicted permease
MIRMREALQDLRHAVRLLTTRPGFTLMAILPLALGIGANTAMFSVLNGVLLRPLPFRDPDRLVQMREKTTEFSQMAVSYPNLQDWQRQNRSFESIAGFRDDEATLTGAGDTQRITVSMVSAPYFEILGANMVLGRGFLAEEDRRGANPVLVLGEEFWRNRFGGDRGIIGRSLTLNGEARTVVGIAPAGLRVYGLYQAYTPLGEWGDPLLMQRDMHPGIGAIARLKPGVTVEQARSDMDGLARRLAEAYPHDNTGHGISMTPLKTSIVGDVRPTLWILTGAVAFVLLIACVNVANLLLARATAREREIAIRASLGASRGRLIRQLLTESVLLSVVGGLAGLGVAVWSTAAIVKLLSQILPQALPRTQDIVIDQNVLLFTLAGSILTGILFGVAPAIQATHSRLHAVMKESGRSLIGGGGRLRDALVVAEVALALVLLAGAGLMIRSLKELAAVNPGFDAHNVLMFNVAIAQKNLKDAQTLRLTVTQLINRVEGIPGIEAVANAGDIPLSGADSEVPFYVNGRPKPTSQGQMSWAIMYPVTPDYLKVMRIPLLRGRFFNEHDLPNSKPVVVIDELFAKGQFPGEDPIGKAILIGAPGMDTPIEIVGVVGHVAHWGLDSDASSPIRQEVYFPFQQIPDQFAIVLASGSTFMARAAGNPLSLVNAVKAQVIGADRDQAVYNVRSMETMIEGSLAQKRFTMFLLAVFAGLALLLAAIGIYAVISYAVSQRTREIGIRMALGARQQTVLRYVVGHGMTLAGIGIVLGCAAALALTRAMSSLLFNVRPWDPLTLTAVAALLAFIALLASYAPARRASRVDPMVALREE